MKTSSWIFSFPFQKSTNSLFVLLTLRARLLFWDHSVWSLCCQSRRKCCCQFTIFAQSTNLFMSCCSSPPSSLLFIVLPSFVSPTKLEIVACTPILGYVFRFFFKPMAHHQFLWNPTVSTPLKTSFTTTTYVVMLPAPSMYYHGYYHINRKCWKSV